jgi:putative transposase
MRRSVLRVGVPPTLARALRSTNCIESMISVCREHAGQRQALARRADGTVLVRGRDDRADKQFRRVNGHLHLPSLRSALERETAESVVPVGHNGQVSAA